MADKKILIVDNDQQSLNNLAELFEAQSLKVIKASDGQAAYDMYKKENPDLVLLEALLPKLHGFDLTQKIYQEKKGTIPIVIVTGLYKGSQYKNEAIRSLGASDYFEKPYDKKKLVSSVINLLHEEIDIDEELPDPDSVMNLITGLKQEGNTSPQKPAPPRKSTSAANSPPAAKKQGA